MNRPEYIYKLPIGESYLQIREQTNEQTKTRTLTKVEKKSAKYHNSPLIYKTYQL